MRFVKKKQTCSTGKARLNAYFYFNLHIFKRGAKYKVYSAQPPRISLHFIIKTKHKSNQIN